MTLLRNLARIRALMAEDLDAHAGDIAVLKMDAVGMRALPEHTEALAAVADYEPQVDVGALARLPEGTFGRAVADFLEANGLSWFAVTDAIDPATRARNVFGIRVARTHDLVHVLTGFDTRWPGEMGVYAFQVGQRWSRWSPVLGGATWLVYPFLTGFRLGALRDAWRRGLAMGRRAPFLLGLRLEDRFGEPLDQVRRDVGLA